MYRVLNTVSEYTSFYISKNITSYNFSFVFKIVKSRQCILNKKDWYFTRLLNNRPISDSETISFALIAFF